MIPDNYTAFLEHQKRMDKLAEQGQECVCCGEKVISYYNVFGDIVCTRCMNDFKVEEDIY